MISIDFCLIWRLIYFFLQAPPPKKTRARSSDGLLGTPAACVLVARTQLVVRNHRKHPETTSHHSKPFVSFFSSKIYLRGGELVKPSVQGVK